MRKQYDTTFVRDTFALVRDLEVLQAAVNLGAPAAHCPDLIVRTLDCLVLRLDTLQKRRQGF
jgi:hypothetical protein